MRRKSKGTSEKGPELLKKWIRSAKTRGANLLRKRPSTGKLGQRLRERLPQNLRQFDFNLKDIRLENISEHAGWIRWGLALLSVFLLAQITAGIIGLFIRPSFPRIPKKVVQRTEPRAPAPGFESIERRNIFNVEGTIPEPFESSLLDCMSQARPSRQPIVLLGTVVMSDERFSTALIQDRGSALKVAVQKGDWFFDGKYQAMKVERKKLCFQVRSTQEFEFVEIPEDNPGSLGVSSPALTSGGSGEGIQPLSDTQFEIKRDFLNQEMRNLNQVLQTARAVPYIEPGTGQFKGFLVQSIDADSPFAQLGIRQGDVLTGVNDIVLDNAGRGLEAFQQLRNSDQIALKVLRGGREVTLNYSVRQ